MIRNRILLLVPVLLGLMTAVHAQDPAGVSPVGGEVGTLIARDRKTFCEFAALKCDRIKFLLRRNDRPGVLRILNKLVIEEARYMDRLAWYFGRDRFDRERQVFFDLKREEILASTPDQVLESMIRSDFQIPEFLKDPAGTPLENP